VNWSSLQNGSDIRGVALEGVADEPVTLTPDIARTLGWAFADWIKEESGISQPRISIGHDSRCSASSLKQGVAEGIELSDGSVGDCGLASTPAMFMSTVFEPHAYEGAIMLTASHLPFNRNGLKFFTRAGGLDKKDITSILKRAEQKGLLEAQLLVRTETTELMPDYSAHLVSIIRAGTGMEKPLDGLHIIVDAGNGAGGFFVEQILQPLGADTTGSQFLEPDGMFPNHIPNPEDAAAMSAMVEAVRQQKADFGIIFDTDVDRAGAVDKKGNPINRNRFIALMAAIVLEEHPGTTVVTDSVTSSGLKQWIESLGGIHHRFKRGYRNVINESIRLNESGVSSELALETSGHGALKENYFLDDGAYQIAKILVKLAQLHHTQAGTIDTLIESLQEPAEALEIRPKIKVADFSAYADQVLEAFVDYVEAQEDWERTPDNFEGVHVTVPNGWILVRKSLHDPQMPINIESNLEGGATALKQQVVAFLAAFDALEF
jgi:phosphomannomutase|tara:strand:- start:1998 stop:3470 length:1473 start_codon:yes stop_codon:yes gene_type:complete